MFFKGQTFDVCACFWSLIKFKCSINLFERKLGECALTDSSSLGNRMIEAGRLG